MAGRRRQKPGGRPAEWDRPMPSVGALAAPPETSGLCRPRRGLPGTEDRHAPNSAAFVGRAAIPGIAAALCRGYFHSVLVKQYRIDLLFPCNLGGHDGHWTCWLRTGPSEIMPGCLAERIRPSQKAVGDKAKVGWNLAEAGKPRLLLDTRISGKKQPLQTIRIGV